MALGFQSQGQQLAIKGVYRGRDIFIQNPYDSQKKSFCIQSVSLNGNTIISAPNSSALTIDLSNQSLNDSVSLLIFHYTECTPKILNPRVLQAGKGFSIAQTSVDNASVSWITTGEQDKKAYYILEKLYLEGWKTLKKIESKGDIDNNQYSIGVVHYSGENQFRVHYLSNGASTYSDIFDFYSAADAISFYPIDEVDEIISLSKATDYIIKDLDEKVYMRGFGLDIFVRELKPGEYILVIENREEAFFKPVPEDY